ncbi:hypothetical protein PPYR_07396 [Photinus pyralis]|uniref:Uncharacterized protein n=2 Tax=Photinus pyralis TaxID=7054 RepID=A0A5N4AQE4_PHOPY|nr:ERC protein 2-like [Photinus pyralis]KAB0799516.1 hypothetical protein PPYR_07396 [Photinus pyralis]
MSRILASNKLSGSGDGVDISIKIETPFSTPPRSPMLAPKPTSAKSAQKKITGQLLQINKITQLATNPKVTRRRSLTLSEINLSKPSNTKKRLPEIQSSPPSKFAKKMSPTKDAGHRIYQLLLLNAWRRQKSKTSEVLETLQGLEAQNSQLVLQIDALHQLRSSENEKRNQALADVNHLEIEIDKREKENDNLKEDTAALKTQLKSTQEGIMQTNLQTQNVKNSLMTSLNDIFDTKCHLGIEQKKSKTLLDETKLLTTQASDMKNEIVKLRDEVQNLEKQLSSTEHKLKENSVSANNYELETAKLMAEIIEEEAKEKVLVEQNARLKANFAMVQDDLRKESKRDSWRNVQDLATTFVDLTKTVLIAMLPALPSNVFNKK